MYIPADPLSSPHPGVQARKAEPSCLGVIGTPGRPFAAARRYPARLLGSRDGRKDTKEEGGVGVPVPETICQMCGVKVHSFKERGHILHQHLKEG